MAREILNIWVATYNHSKFISKTIESILNQVTDFPFRLIIGDDFSTDGTWNICEEYSNKYPSYIKLLPRLERNIGFIANYKRILENSNSDYIAICEGDDYWIDPFKLQKQVNFLESNPDYALISTDIKLINRAGEFLDSQKAHFKNNSHERYDVTFFDLLQFNLINTVTVCVRTNVMIELANEISERNLSYAIDKWYWLNIALRYKIMFLNEKTAVYRIHSNGLSQKKDYLITIVPQIRNDVFRKFIKTNGTSGLKKEESMVIARCALQLINSRYIGFGSKISIMIMTFANPKLLREIIIIIINHLGKIID